MSEHRALCCRCGQSANERPRSVMKGGTRKKVEGEEECKMEVRAGRRAEEEEGGMKLHNIMITVKPTFDLLDPKCHNVIILSSLCASLS